MTELVTIDSDAVAEEHRFSRFELISWWDQDRLRNARVVVIGAGALGNEIVKNLALLGIGNIFVADMDTVDKSNLSRSVLYRATDEGAWKAEVACRSARDIFPDIHAGHFTGNIVHDLGRGIYFWADLVIGGLDNREARVAINTCSLYAGIPWIDGAIEVLNGVARVFAPGDGPCYECSMTENDWKMLEARRSCALLSRKDMNEGKVPTTPTSASIIAGIQVQEALKCLHGLDTMAGQGFIYQGATNESYMVKYTRKPDCFAHDPCGRLEKLGCGVADLTPGELLADARKTLGPDAVVELSRDILTRLDCLPCGLSEPVYSSLGKVTEKQGLCPKCGEPRAPETVYTLGLEEDGTETMSFADLGVPPFDVVGVRAGEDRIAYIFDGDAEAVLGPLSGRQGRYEDES